MIKTGTTSVQDPAAVQELRNALTEECRHYEELLALAHDQGCLMTTHDLDGLEENARQMTDGLAAADAVLIPVQPQEADLRGLAGLDINYARGDVLDAASLIAARTSSRWLWRKL